MYTSTITTSVYLLNTLYMYKIGRTIKNGEEWENMSMELKTTKMGGEEDEGKKT